MVCEETILVNDLLFSHEVISQYVHNPQKSNKIGVGKCQIVFH